MDKLLTIPEVMKILRMSRANLFKTIINEGLLATVILPDGSKRIAPSDLELFINNQKRIPKTNNAINNYNLYHNN